MIIGVAGLGLIGSSVARGLLPNHRVLGVDPDPSVLRAAQGWGVEPVAAATDLIGCDVVLLAAPTGVNKDLLALLMEHGPAVPTADLGSVKEPIVSMWGRRPSFPFVGTHPMAGSERSGCEAGSPDLFRGSVWPVVVTPETDPRALHLIVGLITELGGEALPMSAQRHDEAVAVVSHLPHLQAAALGNVVAAAADPRLLGRLAAGSFRDATRVASSPPDRTSEFVMANAQQAAAAARAAAHELHRAADWLESGDPDTLASWLDAARAVRGVSETGGGTRSRIDIPDAVALRDLLVARRDSGWRVLSVDPDSITVVDGG